MNKIIACICLSLLLLSCQTYSQQHIDANQKDTKQQDARKIIDTEIPPNLKY